MTRCLWSPMLIACIWPLVLDNGTGNGAQSHGIDGQKTLAFRAAIIECLRLSPTDCSESRHGPIGSWDVSSVTRMDGLFVDSRRIPYPGATKFNDDLSKWDVSSVTDMRAMFAFASSFNSDINKWDVSRVTNTAHMFYGASSFDADLSKWDVSRVTNMGKMFSGASSFEQTLCGAWITSTACRDLMFHGSPGQICATWAPRSKAQLQAAIGDCGSPEWDRLSSEGVKGMTWVGGYTTWKQGWFGWTGVRGADALCTSGEGTHTFTVTIEAGTHHQIGVALSSWNGEDTSTSNSNDNFAFLYSQSPWWGRGAARSTAGGWSDTWDGTSKGKHITVVIDCSAHTFTVGTEKQTFLAEMRYPSSWGAVYAAAAGQSADHVYTLKGTAPESIALTWTTGSKTWAQGWFKWTGVRTEQPMCEGSDIGTYTWTVTILDGTHHQIGIALSSWNGAGTSTSNPDDNFAFLYSHTSGWDRHRGAAIPVRHSWSGTWDATIKGEHVTVTLNCDMPTFNIRTERQQLATMSYPSSWDTVYAAAAGQSNDHVYRISDAVLS